LTRDRPNLEFNGNCFHSVHHLDTFFRFTALRAPSTRPTTSTSSRSRRFLIWKIRLQVQLKLLLFSSTREIHNFEILNEGLHDILLWS
jgi:hypothetical protein